MPSDFVLFQNVVTVLCALCEIYYFNIGSKKRSIHKRNAAKGKVRFSITILLTFSYT